MAIKVICDGCATDQTPDSVEQVGRLAPAYYCAACLVIWLDYQRREDAERANLVVAFATWRKENLDALRESLVRLPDE